MKNLSEIVTRLCPFNDPELRPYQTDMKKRLYDMWKSQGRKVMIQMPTGTGKTRLFVSVVKDIIEECRNLGAASPSILIFVHRREIVDQISDTMHEYEINHDKVVGGYDPSEKASILIGTIQTIKQREEYLTKHFDLIIIDEAHHTKASTYISFLRKHPEALHLGFTASPYRLNGEGFDKVFDTLLSSRSVGDFISEGYLSDYEYCSVPDRYGLLQRLSTLNIDSFGDYKMQELLHVMDNDSIRSGIIQAYKTFAEGKKGIVFAIDLNHAKSLAEQYKKIGVKAAFLHCGTPARERKDIIRKFKAGEISVICNVDILGEGFDCPDAEFIQLARPTKSLGLYLQQIGRGLRRTNTKGKVTILDNVGLYCKFGLPSLDRDWQKYFHGLISDDPLSGIVQGKDDNHKVREMDLPYEGDEQMDIVYRSNTDVDCSVFFEEPTGDYKQDFEDYLTAPHPYPTLQAKTAMSYANMIINRIDPVIRERYNPEFSSLLSFIDPERVDRMVEILLHTDTLSLDILQLVLKHYRTFAQQYEKWKRDQKYLSDHEAYRKRERLEELQDVSKWINDLLQRHGLSSVEELGTEIDELSRYLNEFESKRLN